MSTTQAQRLCTLLDRSPYGREPGIKSILQRIKSDLAIRERLGFSHSADAVESMTVALSHFRGSAHGELRAACLASAFNFFFGEGRADRALYAARLIEYVGVASGNLDLRGKARNLMGMAAADMGNIGESLSYYAEALTDSRETQNVIRQAAVLLNTGVALNYAGLYQEAMPCLLEAAQTHPPFTAAAHSNLAQSYAALGDHDNARRTIDRAIGRCEEPQTAEAATAQVIRELTMVQVALEMRDSQLANEHAEICKRYSLMATRRAHWMADIAVGLCQVRVGFEKAGISLLERTLVLCDPNPSMTADCLRALVQAHDEVGNPERALAYLEALVALSRIRRQKTMPPLPSSVMQPARQHDASETNMEERRLRAKIAERKARRDGGRSEIDFT